MGMNQLIRSDVHHTFALLAEFCFFYIIYNDLYCYNHLDYVLRRTGQALISAAEEKLRASFRYAGGTQPGDETLQIVMFSVGLLFGKVSK